MYNREEQILEQYELEITGTSKARGAVLCDTDKGTLLLKEFRGSAERAGFLYEILGFLNAQGFSVETILPAKDGNVLSRDAYENKFLMKTWFAGRECDVKSRDDILEAVKSLAGFHNLARCFEKEIPDFMIMDSRALLEEYERHNRELKKVKNYIRAKHKKNEFEMLFMKQYEYYQNQASYAAVQLREQLAQMEEQLAGQMWGLCHGEFNQHNVVMSRDGTAFINFEQMAYDIQVSDLANFIRKIMEKHNWNTGLGMEMISSYDKVRKLLPEELEQIYFRLAYPKKFWKIANHYYNSRKSWISGRDIEKLQKVLEQEEQREQFLKMLFYFTNPR